MREKQRINSDNRSISTPHILLVTTSMLYTFTTDVNLSTFFTCSGPFTPNDSVTIIVMLTGKWVCNPFCPSQDLLSCSVWTGLLGSFTLRRQWSNKSISLSFPLPSQYSHLNLLPWYSIFRCHWCHNGAPHPFHGGIKMREIMPLPSQCEWAFRSRKTRTNGNVVVM